MMNEKKIDLLNPLYLIVAIFLLGILVGLIASKIIGC